MMRAMVTDNVNSAEVLDAYIASGFVRPDRGRTRRCKRAHMNADGFSKENHNRGNDVVANYSSSDEDDNDDSHDDTGDDAGDGPGGMQWHGADHLRLTKTNCKRRPEGEKAVSGSSERGAYVNRMAELQLPLGSK